MKKSALWIVPFCAALLLPLSSAADNAAPAQVPAGVVQAGGLAIRSSDLSLTPKDGYVYALFDAFPYRQSLKLDSPHPLDLVPIVKALVLKAVVPAMPKATLVKMDVVEFSQRDDYGARRWDTVTRLGKFTIKKSRRGWTVKRISGTDLIH